MYGSSGGYRRMGIWMEKKAVRVGLKEICQV